MRVRLFVALCAVLAVGLTACSSSSTPAPPAPSDVAKKTIPFDGDWGWVQQPTKMELGVSHTQDSLDDSEPDAARAARREDPLERRRDLAEHPPHGLRHPQPGALARRVRLGQPRPAHGPGEGDRRQGDAHAVLLAGLDEGRPGRRDRLGQARAGAEPRALRRLREAGRRRRAALPAGRAGCSCGTSSRASTTTRRTAGTTRATRRSTTRSTRP